ncbi:phosphatase PAP2 family protein [Shewanella sp. A3A]|nr:phosphatase PAP2 family protein [Shewanella ferrihydritica]
MKSLWQFNRLVSVLLMGIVTPHCVIADEQPSMADVVPEIRPGYLQGYLAQSELPDSLALLPPPPAEGSLAYALDLEIARTNVALRDSPRWQLATRDADLSFPAAANTFACAINAPISESLTPHLYLLLRRMLTDAGLATYSAKNRYQRSRPFVSNKAPICTPEELTELSHDGSYPSGHTAIGWAWALVLSEVAPEYSNAVIKRGLAFGESRNVCNVHWHSDVVQGRVIGASTVARLHANAQFVADVQAAKAELLALKTKQYRPAGDCQAEAALLGF